MQYSTVIIAYGGVGIFVEQAELNAFFNAFVCQIWANGTCAVAEQQGKMVHLARFRTFQNNRDRRALLCPHEILLQSGHCEDRRNRHMVFIHSTVRQDKNICPLFIGFVTLDKEALYRPLKRGIFIVEQGNCFHMKPRFFDRFDFQQIDPGENRIVDLQHGAVLLLLHQKVAVAPNVDSGIRHTLLANGINRWICHLGKLLLEIIKKRRILPGEYGKGDICPHGGDWLAPGTRHGNQRVFDLFIGIAEGSVKPVAHLLSMTRYLLVRDREIRQLDKVLVQPFSVRLAGGVIIFDFVILQQSAAPRIHDEHPAGTHFIFSDDMLLGYFQYSDLGGENQAAVIRQIITGRPKPVSVKNSPNNFPVGKENGCRPVPRFHHGCIVPVEVTLFTRHIFAVFPWFGDRDHHGQRQVDPVHHKKFHGVIEHGGVRPGGGDHGKDFVHLILQEGRGHRLLTGKHSVDIAADGIDFSVVQNQPVGVCPFPGRCRVG